MLAAMLGLLLLEPASPQLSLMHLVRPLFPFLGGVSCISALRIVLPILLCPDPNSRDMTARAGLIVTTSTFQSLQAMAHQLWLMRAA